MAKQFNPFHKWLGFDEGLTQPNHFQLFGVKPNSEDPIGFRKQIHSRAKKLLAKLESMSEQEIGDRKKLHTKLRRYVVKAHETLLDDKLRGVYLKGLHQRAREQKGSAKPLAVPPPQKGSPAQTIKNPPTQTMKGSGNKTIKQKSDVILTEKPTVPMAIPLSKPDSHEVVDFESNADKVVNFDNLSSEEIVIQPGRIKRKKSWLIPVICVLMTLLCVAGISGLVMNFGNKLDSKLTARPEASNDQASNIVADATTLKDVPTPDAPPTQDEIRRATEELVNAKREESVEVSKESQSANPKGIREPITLAEPQLQSVRFLFERARKEMKRGRLESASELYRTVDSIFDGGKPSGDQAALFDELNNGREVVKHLEGFWDQVKRSSMKITGGELEPEPGMIIGFVEGRENDVVLRFGENVEIPYRSLRPGLAMLLGSKKGAPNLPAWRLQQAAFRTIHSNDSDESRTKVEELIVAAEADKYDGSAIRGFWDSAFGKAIPSPTMTSVSGDVRRDLSKQLIAGKYKKVSELESNSARDLANGYTSVAYNDPMMRIVALDESVRLSQRCGDAFQMLDSIDELHQWTEVDTSNRKADGFRTMTAKLPAPAARNIGEAFYEFLMSPDASAIEPAKLRKLKNRILESVTRNGLDDLRRLISQTMD
jgi:hypothetical protein